MDVQTVPMQLSDFDTDTLKALIRERGVDRAIQLVTAHCDDDILTRDDAATLIDRVRFLHASLVILEGRHIH